VECVENVLMDARAAIRRATVQQVRVEREVRHTQDYSGAKKTRAAKLA
jgi:hypothetical protein